MNIIKRKESTIEWDNIKKISHRMHYDMNVSRMLFQGRKQKEVSVWLWMI